MSSFVNEYDIHTTQQLIDINGNVINFKAEFTIKSKVGKNFECVVANQQQLDSGEPLKYNISENNEISGNIVNNNNIPQSYYIVLKSQEPNTVIIDVKFEQLPDQKYDYSPTTISPPVKESFMSPFNNGKINWKLIIAIGVLIAVCIAIYYMYFRSEKDPKETTSETVNLSVVKSPPAKSPVRSIVKSPVRSIVKSPSVKSPVRSIVKSPIKRRFKNNLGDKLSIMRRINEKYRQNRET